jgi:glycine dehydrogenase subunit 1
MFVPHTDVDREEMLRTIGVKSIDEFFEIVPRAHRYPTLDLLPALTEMEALVAMADIAIANVTTKEMPSFLGAGAYNHYIPAAVESIISRGEFLTAYTPYQPEISQGTLQAIFEYQSMIVSLTGMDVSNASHYDGATAVAEAVNMSQVIFRGKRKKVVLSPALHPHYRATIRTYNLGIGLHLCGDEPGADLNAGPEALLPYIDDETGIVIVQYPDFFGRVFDLGSLADAVHEAGALLAVAVNPIALAMFKSPGEYGADIVTGEGQPLGIPMAFGGPYLGILATRQKYVRSLAGRLVGETVDSRGQRGFVLTLNTREQHIRRERASSNICSNQGLVALAATVYISLLGKQGLRQVAELCYHKAHYAADQITSLPDYEMWSDQPFFNEFVVRGARPGTELNQHLLEHGIVGGYALGQDYPDLADCTMYAVTEMIPRDIVDYLVSVLSEEPHD